MAIGIVYTFSYTMLLIAPSQTAKLFAHEFWLADRHVDLAVPLQTGTAMVLGVLLLVGAFSVQRWQRWPRPQAAAAQTTTDSDRPLSTDGLGLTPANGDTEPEQTVRYPTSASASSR